MIGWIEASWLDAIAGGILAGVLALVALAITLTAIEALPLRRELPSHAGDWDTRELAADWPPEYEPEFEPGDDGLYADAGAEIDQWHEETTDGNA